MKLYLVQHGDALPKNEAPDRPLSEQGRKDIDRVTELLTRSQVEVSRILHSGKTRAQQTAKLIAHGLGKTPAVTAAAGLSPNDLVAPWVDRIDGYEDNSMLVGHQPFLGKFVSHLLTGSESEHLVHFHPGSVVCLVRDKNKQWGVAWMIPPGLTVRQ